MASQLHINTFLEKVESYRRAVNPFWVEGLEQLGWVKEYTEAHGTYLKDANGHSYLDLVGGFGTTILGHNHSMLNEMLSQALTSGLPATMPLGISPIIGLLGEKLCSLAGTNLQKVYFGNSGAEGIEAAMKFAMARTKRSVFLSFTGGFHGLTLGALSLVGGGSWKEPFPVTGATAYQVEVKDFKSIENYLASYEIAGIVLEIVQGVGGAKTWEASDLQHLANLCHQFGTLLIVDEVLTGLGRTGKWFAFQWAGEDFFPDIVVISKALTGGIIPVSAVLMTDEVFRSVYGSFERVKIHGSTFSGNLLAMVAGLGVIKIIEKEGLLHNVGQVSNQLVQGITKLQEEGLGILEVRGKGLVIGIRISGINEINDQFGAAFCWQQLLERGVMTYVAPHAPSYLKLTPAFTLSKNDVDFFLDKLKEVLYELKAIQIQL